MHSYLSIRQLIACDCVSLWDNWDAVQAFPRFGGWTALIRNFSWLLRLHVIIGLLVIEVSLSNASNGRTTNTSFVGLIEVFDFLLSDAGPATLTWICQIDAAMIIAEAVL